jgi:transposase
MGTKFVNVDRKTPMMFPPDMREWVCEDDMVHFVIDTLEQLPAANMPVNERGSGSAQYPPHMLLELLVYCYASGLFSSRKIEKATYRDIAIRYLTADTHPDHSTICAFRKNNRAMIQKAFVHVLKLAKEMKVFQVGTISVDGTHIKANASKYKNIAYDRAKELDKKLEQDIAEMLDHADAVDEAESDEDIARLPKELCDRKKLRERIRQAAKALEDRAKARAEEEREAYEEKVSRREKRKGLRKGKMIQPPDPTPKGMEQINMTDSDSRIMRKNNGAPYEQAYNAQVAVDADGSQLIVSKHVTQCSSDSNELLPALKKVRRNVGNPKAVLADSGYVNHEAIEAVQARKVDVYVAVSKDESHSQRRYEYRPKTPASVKKTTNPVLVAMRAKLQTEAGKKMYALRKQTVEPVFGIVKHVLGFRQFLLRGLDNVACEWDLVCLAYNMKRLFALKTA